MSSILELQPSETRSFRIKTGGPIWVPGTYIMYIYIHSNSAGDLFGMVKMWPFQRLLVFSNDRKSSLVTSNHPGAYF